MKPTKARRRAFSPPFWPQTPWGAASEQAAVSSHHRCQLAYPRPDINRCDHVRPLPGQCRQCASASALKAPRSRGMCLQWGKSADVLTTSTQRPTSSQFPCASAGVRQRVWAFYGCVWPPRIDPFQSASLLRPRKQKTREFTEKLTGSYQYIGGGKGSRTPDLLNAIQTLYQLSYTPTSGEIIGVGITSGDVLSTRRWMTPFAQRAPAKPGCA